MSNEIILVRGNDTNFNGINFLTINLTTTILDLSTMKAKFSLGNIIRTFDDLSSGTITLNFSAQETSNLPSKLNGVLQLIDTNNKIATIESIIPFKVIDIVHGNAIATEPYTLDFTVEQGGENILTVSVESAVTVEVGTTTTLSAGSNATVTNVGEGNHLILDFGIPKGKDGINGSSAIISSVTATIDNNVGTPSVDVTLGGTDLNRTIDLAFHNLKGADGSDADVTYTNVINALGYTPYDSSNPNGYTSNIGTVTSVNNVSPVNGNITLSIPPAQVNSDWNANSGVAKILNKPTIPTDTSDLTNNAGYITSSALSGYATETWVTDKGYITGITSTDVTTALGYTPYDSSNPNGYTNNIGTVTSVNNVSPVSGNVTISIPSDTSDLTNGAGFITSSALNNYEQKTTITALSATDSITLADNTIYNGGTQTALTIALPSSATVDFICEIDFSSGTTATTLTYPQSGITWFGDDIVTNIFTPAVSKRYTIICSYNGNSYIFVVKGV